MKLFFYLGLLLSCSLHLCRADVLDDFFSEQAVALKDLGDKHPSKLELQRIKFEKDRCKAMELALQYSLKENKKLNNQNNKFDNKISHIKYSIKIENNNEKKRLFTFLDKLLQDGKLTKLESNLQGFSIIVNAKSAVSIPVLSLEYPCSVKEECIFLGG